MRIRFSPVKNRIGNLLFVNVRLQDTKTVALFDAGTGMTVIAQRLFNKLEAVQENEVLCVGNNNGFARALRPASPAGKKRAEPVG